MEILSTEGGAKVKSVLLLTDGIPSDDTTKEQSAILNEMSKLQSPATGENTTQKVIIIISGKSSL